MHCPGVGYGQKVEDHMGLRKGSSGEDDFIVITRRVQGRVLSLAVTVLFL